MEGGLVVAGDFNAKAVEWGMPEPNSRGKRILEMASRRGLIVLNTGSTTTFRRPGYGETIPDISLASENLAPAITDWEVIEDYTGSDHQYITFTVSEKTSTRKRRTNGPPRWNPNKLDKERLTKFLQTWQLESLPATRKDQDERGNAEALVKDTMRLLHRACDASMPRKGQTNRRHPAYWWTGEIADLRKKCLRLRRIAQRARGRADAAKKSVEHKDAKKKLRATIKRSKISCWRKLTSDVNNDPWGLGYKIVTRKLGASQQDEPHDSETMEHIVSTLFPNHPRRDDEEGGKQTTEEIPLFSEEELAQAAKTLQNKKAPGPDGIPAELLKAVATYSPKLLLNMYNNCLRTGLFHKDWKRQRLVLISKGKGDPNSPSAYRPLCMLDTAGKLLEKLLKPRLLLSIQGAGDLSSKQYGFRSGRSTVDAIQEVIKAATEAQQGNHHSRQVTLLATLDVKNAFNSAGWNHMLNALEMTFRIPQYLLRILKDYLKDRVLLYNTEDGPRERDVTAGAAQGSILGPDLWNVFYDSILHMEMPMNTLLVGYADDIAVIIRARNTDGTQLILNQVMRRVSEWMEEHGLELAAEKTEIVLLTRKRIPTIAPFQVGIETIQSKEAVKYLGIMIDTKLTYWEQVRRAADKAAKVTTALSRLMANTNGPRPSKRRLLMTVTQSILLYGAEIWADALKIDLYRKRMAGVQRRSALRVACSYRTVSEPAALVIAGVIPIDLLAQEKKRIAIRKLEIDRTQAKEEARKLTMLHWQERWKNDHRGRWTARLITDLAEWVDRKHGEANYYLTQFLSGHGYFRAYLYKRKKATSAECAYCGASRDDAQHTFFLCDRWTMQRRQMESNIGTVTPENIIKTMTSGEEKWNTVATYVETVLRTKKAEEHLNDALDATTTPAE